MTAPRTILAILTCCIAVAARALPSQVPPADSAGILIQQGMVILQQGSRASTERAIQLFFLAARLSHEGGDRSSESRALTTIGLALRDLGNEDSALAYLHRGLALPHGPKIDSLFAIR